MESELFPFHASRISAMERACRVVAKPISHGETTNHDLETWSVMETHKLSYWAARKLTVIFQVNASLTVWEILDRERRSEWTLQLITIRVDNFVFPRS